MIFNQSYPWVKPGAWVYNETEFDPSHKDYFCFNKKQSMNSTGTQISPSSTVSTARQHSACYPISWFTLAKKNNSMSTIESKILLLSSDWQF